MIRGCDGVCHWNEDGSKIQPMSDTIHSRYSNISQEDWDRIFKRPTDDTEPPKETPESKAVTEANPKPEPPK